MSGYWVPDLEPGMACVLAVSRDCGYQQAIREKLILLLAAEGQHGARIAIAHLDLEESQIQHEDFPSGWADQILACNGVKKMVLTGSPDVVAAANEAMARDAVERQSELTLEKFLAAC